MERSGNLFTFPKTLFSSDFFIMLTPKRPMQDVDNQKTQKDILLPTAACSVDQ